MTGKTGEGRVGREAGGQRRSRSASGFTLVEIMLVLVVLGIMGVLVVPKYQGMRLSAQEEQSRTQLKMLNMAIMSYIKNYQALPESGITPLIRQLANARPLILAAPESLDAFGGKLRYATSPGLHPKYYYLQSPGLDGRYCELLWAAHAETLVVKNRSDDLFVSNAVLREE
jgi:general secretion pathway protein G